MKNYIDVTTLFIVAFLLLTRPNVLVNFSNTFFGKLILISVLVVTTLHSTLSGIFIGLLIVMLSENVYEGMENQKNSEEQNSEQSVKEFRDKHCSERQTFVDSKGNELSLEEIKQKYPSIKFDNDTCNPCDNSCNFQITDSSEQLNVQHTLRAKNSKEINVKK